MEENLENLRNTIIDEIMVDVNMFALGGSSEENTRLSITDLVGTISAVAFLDGVRATAIRLKERPEEIDEMARIDPIKEALYIMLETFGQ